MQEEMSMQGNWDICSRESEEASGMGRTISSEAQVSNTPDSRVAARKWLILLSAS